MDKLLKLTFLACLAERAFSACIFPSVFSQSSWIDNVKGDITFTTWEMKGWRFTVGNYNITDWEIVDNTRFDTDGYLALRSHDTFEVSGTTYHSFACLKFSLLSDDTYKYYNLHDMEPIAGNERVKVYETDALTRFEDICNTTYSYDETSYNILIKKGTDPKSTCPNPILGTFDYTLEYPNGTTTCVADDDTWEGCKDNKIIELNYTACSAEIAYSAEGRLSCVDSTTYNQENDVQILVYNLDETVDNLNTFRFSCIRVTEDGKEMSIAPSFCREGQTPYIFPKEGNLKIGQKLTTTELSNCRIYPSPPDDQKKLSTEAIIGIAVGGGVLLIIIIVIVLCIVCRRCSK